jgi:chromosome segregation ATPase
MIQWLDEEMRRDRTLIVELRQRVESQAVELVDQNKRVQELEGRLAGTQARLTRFNVLEQAISQIKDELVQLIHNQELEIEKYQREQIKARQVEMESVSRAMNELRRSLDVIAPLQERLTVLKAEDQRLSEGLIHIGNRLTSHERQMSQLPDRIGYVESQRGQDVKKVSALETEVTELLRRIETQVQKLQVVDDIARKTEQHVNGMLPIREELTRKINAGLEEMRLLEATRDRQTTDWKGDIARFDEEMGKHRAALERFSRKQDDAQQVLVAIEEYKQILSREQKQVAELQRMSEERQKREMDEWIAANEQRWTKHRLERDAQWHQQQSRNEAAEAQLKKLAETDAGAAERIQRLQRELLAMQEEYRAKLKELWQWQERQAIFSLDQVRRWYDETHTALAERGHDK